MKITIVIFSILFYSSFSSNQSDVYICGAKGAKKYHFSQTCRGLNNCKHVIKKVTKKEAENLGLSLCGWED